MPRMLQALGSTSNAKIGYVMYSGCCILIVGTFIFVANFERTSVDDSYAYCATAYYSPKTNYQVEYHGQINDFDKISNGCARACYKEQRSTNGLAFLEIETHSGCLDYSQAISAGILEGSLTWMSIYSQWKNTIIAFCEQDEKTGKFCTWLRDIVDRNFKNIIKYAKKKHKVSLYQHQILLVYQQMQGIEIGLKKGVKRARYHKDLEEIPFEDILLLNARVDIEDLKEYYNKYVEEDENDHIDIQKSFSKTIIKLMNGETPKVLIGHTSDGDYNSMLKIVKTYRFNFHQGPEPEMHLVPNTDITFSSYPGAIASMDDFYLANGKHSKIIVAGVKTKYEKSMQIHGIDIDGAVFLSARVMSANRLGHNGLTWAKVMARDPDIGAKQWLVIDEKRLKYLKINNETEDVEEFVTSSTSTLDESLPTFDNNEVPTDVINDVEALIPAMALQQEVNHRNIIWLIDNTWRRLHGEDVTVRLKKDKAWISDGTPYFKVIQELNKIDRKDFNTTTQQIENLDDIASILKSNAYRGDLSDDVPFGNTDIKLYSSIDHNFLIQNGPIRTSKDESNAFEWDKFNDISHADLPSEWNFPSVMVQYIWN